MRMSEPPTALRAPGIVNSAAGRAGGNRPVLPKIIASAISTGGCERGKLARTDDPTAARLSVILGAGGGFGSPLLISRIDVLGGIENISGVPILALGDVSGPRTKSRAGDVPDDVILPKSLAALLPKSVVLRVSKPGRLPVGTSLKEPLLLLTKPFPVPEPVPESPNVPELPLIKRLCRSNSTRAGLLDSELRNKNLHIIELNY